ncbi:hypothetical protein MTR67_048091 [Solanum verrucosum]|uniref:Uncharacterized protein n=1 Tax=Solanum verrucosum TaxID=315347 RepID=A0AAF0ZX16_SOLVR|nr:hypothetical protein MTR67_048091 [Solanum verrucosum]
MRTHQSSKSMELTTHEYGRAVRFAIVNTKTNASHNNLIISTPNQIGQQLTTIATKLGAIDALAADVVALKAQNMQNQHGKSKVLLEEGEENYGPVEFQNPDEHLCSIQQTGSVFEYRQEYAKRAARVQTWPEHCLLGVFLSGIKKYLRVDVRIHKLRSMYKVMSLALEYEGKQGLNQSSKVPAWASVSRPSSIGTSSPTSRESFNFQSSRQQVTRPFQQSSLPKIHPLNSEQQIQREKGLYYRCGDKFTLVHRSLEEQMLPRDAMLNLMKEEYKNIDLSSKVGDASVLRLRPYDQKSL